MIFNYIIATRNPRTGLLVIIHKGDDDEIAEFESEEEAREAADNTTICKAWGYELIEVSAPPVEQAKTEVEG